MGFGLDVRPDPPPPQPTGSAMRIANIKMEVNLATGVRMFLWLCVFICISPGGDQAARLEFLSPPFKCICFWLWGM